MLLGLVLLAAAWAKLLDPAAFTAEIERYGLDFAVAAEPLTFIALGLEVGVGMALVLGIRRLWVLVPAAALVALFMYLTGRDYVLDLQGLLPEDASCGCFGNLVERTPAEAFWQDLALLVPPLALAFLGRRRGGPRVPPVRTAVVAVTTLGAAVFAYHAPQLPLDDLATRLKPGVEAGELCLDSEQGDPICLTTVVPELAQGRHVVVMTELDAEEFTAKVPALNDYTFAGDGPTLWVLSAATPDEQGQFFWQFGPAFEVRETPQPLLRPLYRQLPRSFLVEDGRVLETYRALPPLERLADGGEETEPAPDDDSSRSASDVTQST